jgi:hypothetical protein
MLDRIDFTPRGVAKFVVNAAVAAKVSATTVNAIDENTRYDKDNFLVGTTGTLVGAYVSAKLEPLTDKAVDLTADFITAQREKYETRRSEKNTAEKA